MADKKQILKDEQMPEELYRIARKKGTEAPFSGKYWNNHEKGVYKCAICGTELFSSDTKFDSGTGWPSFTRPLFLPSDKLRRSVTDRKNQADEKSDSQKIRAGFNDPENLENIILRPDFDHGMERTEVVCKTCGAHLGHLFDDGPIDWRLPAGRQGKRYCINSACLLLDKE